MEYHVYWLLKSSCFANFGDRKDDLFLSQKVDGKMVFTDYWKGLLQNFSKMQNTVIFSAKKLMERWYVLIIEKVLFWTFQRWEVRSFFERKNWWKDDNYWLLKSSCFELFGDGKHGLFLSQKVDGKMIFTWSFWTFHDIPGFGKYGFSCSVFTFLLPSSSRICPASSRRPGDVPWRSSKGPNVRDLQWTFRGPIQKLMI